ncbi:MAG: DUF6067 family protein [Kiritimatiellia bacterium]
MIISIFRTPASRLSVMISALFLVSLFFSPAVRAAEVNRPRLTVPRLAAAPDIDGKMSEGEWDRAAVMTGFIGATGGFGKVMVPKKSRIYLAHADGKLYVAVWTQLAPGEKPTMKYRRRDSKVFMDRQQFEIWLTPPTAGHVAAYQIIGNAYGAVYDLKHVPKLGIKNPGWSPEFDFENSYKVGEYWIAEVAIPFDAVADPDHFQPGEPWGGMVAVAWPQRSWPYTHGWYHNIDTHALMTMGKTDTCVRLLDADSLFENRLAPDMVIVNGEARDADFKVTAKRKDKVIEKTYSIPAGETAKVDIDAELPPAKKRVNTVNLRVTGPGDAVILEGDWMYRPLDVAERKTEEVEPEPWRMTTRVDYAPLTMAARCWVDLLDAPMRDKVAEAVFTVKDPGGSVVPVRGPFGKTVNQAEDDTFKFDAAEAHIWLPKDLEPGTYTITTAFRDENGKVLESKDDKFKHKDFTKDYVWLNSDKYGENFTVAPPYEPITVKGRTLRVYGRKYVMKGALPSKITSQGTPLLARPVTFFAVTEDGERESAVTKAFNITGRSGDAVVEFEGQYEVAGITLDLDGRMFYDGALIYSLKASPGADAEKINRLYLSVPVPSSAAQSMWTTRGGSGGGYHNFIEAFGDGEGTIWSSDSLADFTPYLGLCNDDVAIQWFADHDHDWILGAGVPCSELVRNGDAVEMRINLVRSPSKGESLRARFGLITAPIKPLPSAWRNTVLHYGKMADSRINFFYGPGHGKVGPFNWHDSAGLAKANGIEIPKGRKASAALDSMSGEGYPDLESIKKVHGNDPHGFVQKGLKCYEDPTATKQCFFHNASMYFEGNKSKAFRSFFKGEWTIVPSGGWFHLRPVESYQDFFCFHLTQFIKFWTVPGMYYDECYFAPDYNVFNGHGKIMPDGSIRPSVGLLHQRRLLYRTRQCMVDEGIPPFIWVHTSGMMAPYAIGAADIAMFGEPNIPTPQQDIMDNIRPAYMRIIGRSQKFGFIPVWMTMAGRGGAQWSLAGRQTFGWCWLHDTVPEVHTHHRGRPLVEYRQQWGIDRDDVAFHSYWNRNAVIPSDERFLASYWTRPHPDDARKNTALLLVMNMNYRGGSNTEVRLTLDAKALGLPSGFKVYNMETMPQFVKREKILRECDREARYGAGSPEQDPMATLGRDLYFWRTGKPYDLDKLQTVSKGKSNFTVSIPARDFVHLLVR